MPDEVAGEVDSSQLGEIKPWAELTADEKIDRLRTTVNDQKFMIEELMRRVYAAQTHVDRMLNHVHGGNGEVYVPLRNQYHNTLISQPSPSGYDSLA